jgi:hypothetical protein
MRDGIRLRRIFFLDQVNAPIQLICRSNDPRCPASDSMDARDKLVELEKVSISFCMKTKVLSYRKLKMCSIQK